MYCKALVIRGVFSLIRGVCSLIRGVCSWVYSLKYNKGPFWSFIHAQQHSCTWHIYFHWQMDKELTLKMSTWKIVQSHTNAQECISLWGLVIMWLADSVLFLYTGLVVISSCTEIILNTYRNWWSDFDYQSKHWTSTHPTASVSYENAALFVH